MLKKYLDVIMKQYIIFHRIVESAHGDFKATDISLS